MPFYSLAISSRTIFSGIILSAVVALSSASAAAEENLIRFSIPPNGWPPYVITAGDHSSGMMVDAVREITAKLGYEFQISIVPEKRMLIRMAKDQVDAWPKSPDWVKNADEFYWTDPIVDVSDHLIYAKGTGQSFNSAEDLRGKRVATILGFGYPTYEPHFEKGLLARVDVYNPNQMLEMVARGRVDAAIINKHVAQWLMKTNDSIQADNYKFSRLPVDTTGYALMISKSSGLHSFIEDFNHELGKMKSDGTLETIFEKYK